MPNDTLNFMLDAGLSQINAMKAEAEMYERTIQQFGGVLGNLEKQLAQMEEALSRARLDHGRELKQIEERLVGLTAEFDRIMEIQASLKTITT